jgi:RNA polymerase sigma factor for flagellar operon FliA
MIPGLKPPSTSSASPGASPSPSRPTAGISARHHLAQAQPDARERAGPADEGARVPVPAEQERAVFLRRRRGAGALEWSRSCARSLAARLRLRDPDALENAAAVGLWQASERFDGSRGLKFRTYAVPVVRGAVLDWLRQTDVVSPYTRRAIREGRFREPVVLRLDAARTLAGRDGPPGEGLERRELARRARDCLDRRDRLVVVLYHYEGLTMKEIAEVLGYTPSNICHVLKRAYALMREHLAALGVA